MTRLTHHRLGMMFGCLAVAACGQQPSPLTDAQRAAAVEAARGLTAGVMASTDRLDFPAAMQAFSSDADARFVENGSLYPSRDAMQKAYAELAPLLESIK